jgi:hypothetical protein
MKRAFSLVAMLVVWASGLRPALCAAQPEPATAPAPTFAAASTVVPDTPAGRQLRWALGVLNGDDPGAFTDRFTPDFLQAVPEAKLGPVFAQLRAAQFSGGPVEVVRIESGATETHLGALIHHPPDGRPLRVTINIDPDTGKMAGLMFTPAPESQIKLASWDELDTKLKELPGRVAVLVEEMPEPDRHEPGPAPSIHGLHADERLALGSTFKLFVLEAITKMIGESQARWDEKLAIRDDLKSLPSGEMQTQPAGTEFTIAEFAAKMISISDNTAADHLLMRAGRDRVEASLEAVAAMCEQDGADRRSLPFLTTLEMFKIKLAEDRMLGARYAAADENTRRAMIGPDSEVTKAVPDILLASVWKKPQEIDRVEWFASARECCQVMVLLHRHEQVPGNEPLSKALRINPGIPFDRGTWKSIAYKGGSEPGVLNLTWMLERQDGRWFLASFGWNNTKAGLDDEKLLDLAQATVALLADYDRPKSPSAQPPVGR